MPKRRALFRYSRHYGLQLIGFVSSFGLVHNGPRLVFASGTVMKATGPALCSPLNGVGLVTSNTHPSTFASLGLLNQNPRWNVLIGFGLLWSGSNPKIWSSRMV